MRNYKVSGKKLQPKDSYEAFEQSHYRWNAKQRRRERAIEIAAHGGLDGQRNAQWKKIDRLARGLSTRYRRHVERLVIQFERNAIFLEHLPRRQQRLYAAHIGAFCEEMADATDRITLAGAY